MPKIDIYIYIYDVYKIFRRQGFSLFADKNAFYKQEYSLHIVK